jgi:chloramphenicol O-acetyltransferase
MESEAETLYSLVKEKHGDRIAPEELDEVKKTVERIVEASMELREVELGNWDEPFSVFKPYRREGE